MDENLLEARHAARVLIYIDENPGCTKTAVLDSITDGGRRTAFLRIGDLIEAGYVRIGEEPRPHNIMHLYPTEAGRRAATLWRMLREV